MNFSVFDGKLIVECNVLEVRTFDRRSGEKGQEVIISTNKGYRCPVDAVDVSVCDFSKCVGVQYFYIEPFLTYDKFVSSSGKTYSKNFGSFRFTGMVTSNN